MTRMVCVATDEPFASDGASGTGPADGASGAGPSDGAATWEIGHDFTKSLDDTYLARDNAYIPFGNIVQAADGSLCASAYLKRGVERESYLFRSQDDGRTWTVVSSEPDEMSGAADSFRTVLEAHAD